MGFEGRKTLKLNFDDPDLAGLEVVTRRPSLEQVLAVGKAADKAAAKDDGDDSAVSAMADLFIETLIGWNLENDGEPVPHNAKALMNQDQPVAQAIIEAWEENAIKSTRVPAPLATSSNVGEPSLAASLPMEPLPQSQAS
jgi:hypothetical protein